MKPEVFNLIFSQPPSVFTLFEFNLFLTDSPVLGEYLCAQHFRSEVQGAEWGVELRIYDVLLR